MSDAYRLCPLGPEGQEFLVDAVNDQNAEALEMKEHRNCLVGCGRFYEGGVVVSSRCVRFFHQGLCLKLPEAEECILTLLEDSPTGVFHRELKPYLLGIVARCGQRSLPAFCEAALSDSAAAVLLGEKLDQPPLLVYSSTAIIANLQTDGMSEEEAEEFFGFNIIDAWAGPGTPLFL